MKPVPEVTTVAGKHKMDPVFVAWLQAERDRLREELLKAQAAFEQVEKALARVKGEAAEAPPEIVPAAPQKNPRGFVKEQVLRLLDESAETGLSATDLVDRAAAQGIALDRNSVSSLLSKLKAEGTLELEGNRYRPARPNPKTPSAGLGLAGGAVHAPWRI